MDPVLRDLDAFDAAIAGSPDLQRLVRSPVFSADEQVRSIDAIIARMGLASLAANFIRVVASKRRLFALPAMIRAYRALVAEAKGVVTAQVRVAEQPSPRMLDDIKAALRDVAKTDVDVDVTVDPALIGGLVVQMGSRMVDASLRTKLNHIRLAMKEVR